jgi:(p)ppGpp synthase/HD superfamily hydrolase
MIFTPRLDEAIKLASRLHREQTRSDNERTPYVSHLVAVAAILSSVTDDEDIIIAGLMHDSLEDVPHYTYDSLVADCGARVADIVTHVTEPLDANKDVSDQLPWLTRKEAYLAVLRSGGVESAMVSSADKIHNTESFIRDIQKEDGVFASRFSSSARNRLWFHEQSLAIVTEKLGGFHALVCMFRESTDSFRKLVTQLEEVRVGQ